MHLTLARCLRMEAAHIRVIKPFIGGGFGHRTDALNFEVICALLARAAAAPCVCCKRAKSHSWRTVAVRKVISA